MEDGLRRGRDRLRCSGREVVQLEGERSGSTVSLAVRCGLALDEELRREMFLEVFNEKIQRYNIFLSVHQVVFDINEAQRNSQRRGT